jgi:hypothetical protein
MKAVEIFISLASDGINLYLWFFLQFSIMLLLVFILELSGGIAGYVLRNRAHDFLNHKLNESMYDFNSSDEIKKLWYMMQTSVSSLKCKHV